MYFDYSKLEGRIIEKLGTRGELARRMHLSTNTISNKLNNKLQFKQSEIDNAMQILDLSLEDIPAYFFTRKVQ